MVVQTAPTRLVWVRFLQPLPNEDNQPIAPNGEESPPWHIHVHVEDESRWYY